MKLLRVEFVTSAAAGGRATGIPNDDLPQIGLAGRSNVGKSSLLNALFRRRLARTSAAPGKTRLANVYRAWIDAGPGGPGRWSVYLVDLPGYGYARGGAAAAAGLQAVAEAYYRTAAARVAVATLLLVDARHPGLDADLAAARWLRQLDLEWRLVATKVDKLSRGARARNLTELERTLGQAALPVSAVSGEGLDELWQMIATLARR